MKDLSREAYVVEKLKGNIVSTVECQLSPGRLPKKFVEELRRNGFQYHLTQDALIRKRPAPTYEEWVQRQQEEQEGEE